MQILSNYYLQSFEKHASAKLDDILFNDSLSNYALMLNLKANAILKRACLNVTVDISKLQSDIFQTGRAYVQKFSVKQKELKRQKDSKGHRIIPSSRHVPQYVFSNN